MTRTSKAVSPIISTLIISGVLLVILAISSFVSTNVLELQIAATEFEQAKTSMMLLDDIIQDVALRRGSGSYVTFNQRSGGIGVAETSNKIAVEGPIHEMKTLRSPTATSPSAGGWNDPALAFSENDDYAWIDSGNPSVSQNYSGYELNVPSSNQTTILKVEVRIDAQANQDTNIRLQISCDNGVTWSPSTPISQGLSTTKTTSWLDVTSYAGNPDEVNRIQTRVDAMTTKKQAKVYLHWIAVQVTYRTDVAYESPPLMSIVYRGGSQASGSALILKGNENYSHYRFVNNREPIGYLRVEHDDGLKIKLDYFRVRVVELETLLTETNESANFVQLTFLHLVKGNMGGSGTVSVKLQNIGVRTISQVFPIASVPMKISDEQTISVGLDPGASKTVVMTTEIIIQVSTV